jgi:hypothetical protein
VDEDVVNMSNLLKTQSEAQSESALQLLQAKYEEADDLSSLNSDEEKLYL